MLRTIVLIFLCSALSFSLLAQEPAPPSGERQRPSGPRRGMRSRATPPPGIFGAETAPSPNASGTVLGGTVPTLWELEQSTPEMDDEHFASLMERNTIAPSVPGKVIRYAARLMQLYDGNADGVLQEEEWKKMPGAPQAMDIDGDHEISLEELLRFLALYGQDRTIHRPQPIARYYQPKIVSSQLQLFKPVLPPLEEPPKPEVPDESAEAANIDLTEEGMEEEEAPIDDETYEAIAASHQTTVTKKYSTAPETLRGLPAWFLIRDKDGDGQVSLKEFAPSLSASSLALFGRLDKNGDGFITPDEVRTPPPTPVAEPENNASDNE